MAKKKKTLLSFMMLGTTAYAFWGVLKGISQETTIPLALVLLLTLLIYVIWKDEDE